MKITNISAHLMSVQIPRPGGPSPRRNWIFVRIDTDEGITGVGEATTEYHEYAVKAMIEQQYGPFLKGKDPTKINRAWQEMQRLFWWRGGVVASSAASGIEQALWDITGKIYDQPVYKLLGGAVRDRVRVYARNDLGLAGEVEELESAVYEGYTAFKTGPGRYHEPFDEEKQVDSALSLFKNLREKSGPDIDLMIDCLGNFSLQAACRLMSGLRELRLLFIEEPVNGDTPRALVSLRKAFPDLRIAAGERLCTRWGVREFLENGSVDVLQVDICHCGGISEMMRIAAFAEVYNVFIAPHNPYGPVALAANLHACAAMQNFLILEHWRHPEMKSVEKWGPTMEEGYLRLPELPGLGVDLDWEYVAEHPYVPLTTFHFIGADGGMASI